MLRPFLMFGVKSLDALDIWGGLFGFCVGRRGSISEGRDFWLSFPGMLLKCCLKFVYFDGDIWGDVWGYGVG